jgi:hypothetical protein
MSELYPVDETEPVYRRVVIHVCQNCLDRKPGQCHAPGCFYIRHNIEEVPSYLHMYVDQEARP